MTIVTHHDTRSYADSKISAVPVSALSAIGSATLPNEVTSDHFRAIQPSTKSVAEARQKTRQAGIRAPFPSSPEAIPITTNTGTSTIRSTVRTFAGLYGETTLAAVAGTGSTSPDYVGPSLMYTQIVSEFDVAPGMYHHVAIRYTRDMTGDNVKFFLDGKLVDTVANVGIPLDRRGAGQHWTGTYPSLGPGELLRPYLNSFQFGHGTFSLIDAFPFQWGWTPDYDGSLPCVTAYAANRAACDAGVSMPLSERLFGQGVIAHFDNFTTTTKGD